MGADRQRVRRRRLSTIVVALPHSTGPTKRSAETQQGKQLVTISRDSAGQATCEPRAPERRGVAIAGGGGRGLTLQARLETQRRWNG